MLSYENLKLITSTRKSFEIFLPYGFAILYFILNYTIITKGHFHEDAYVLFTYVDSLLQGNGITYNSELGATEGATDFLWYILLTMLSLIKIDVGIASIILNSAGVWLVVHFLYKSIRLMFLPFPALISVFTTCFFLLTSGVLLGGFSVFLFLGLIAWVSYGYLSLTYKEKHPNLLILLTTSPKFRGKLS